MLIAVYSPKGGSGCSVVSALLALATAGAGRPVLLVDLFDDLAPILGTAPPDGPALADLAALGPGLDPQAIDDVATEVGENLMLIAASEVPHPPSGAPIPLLHVDHRTVIVDAGCLLRAAHPWARDIVATADRSILVVRPCYLALSRCHLLPVPPTEIVVVREPGRSFDTAAIAKAVGAPVSHEIAVDTAVARAVDAGLLRSRALGRTRWMPAA